MSTVNANWEKNAYFGQCPTALRKEITFASAYTSTGDPFSATEGFTVFIHSPVRGVARNLFWEGINFDQSMLSQ